MGNMWKMHTYNVQHGTTCANTYNNIQQNTTYSNKDNTEHGKQTNTQKTSQKMKLVNPEPMLTQVSLSFPWLLLYGI